jgi:hypothetical protein
VAGPEVRGGSPDQSDPGMIFQELFAPLGKIARKDD